MSWVGPCSVGMLPGNKVVQGPHKSVDLVEQELTRRGVLASSGGDHDGSTCFKVYRQDKSY